ncbi:MAG: FAD:protein FMN transferase [Terricaulis sp.]
MNRVLVPHIADQPRPPREVSPIELGGETMGTSWRLRAFAPQGFDTPRFEADLNALFDDFVAQMSLWAPDSIINRFNELPAGAWLELPLRFQAVLAHALAVAEETDGAFDPTIGALVDLWGFGARSIGDGAQSASALASAKRAAGWRTIARDGPSKIRQPGGVRLDLNGIAKGHAVDEASLLATRSWLSSHLMEIGGELRGVGVKPDGEPWWVDVEQPPHSSAPRTLAALYNMAIATSGDYRRNALVDGRNISHTLAPATGWPIVNGVASVTVLHASCMLADAYATALKVLGPERGIAFANAKDIAALILVRTDDGFSEYTSAAAERMLA